jgi:hypothetical protein
MTYHSTPEDIAKDYQERFSHGEPAPVVPDGAAGTVRRDMTFVVSEDERYIYHQRCELCPSPSGGWCERDCAEVRRIAYAKDGVLVTPVA